MKGLIIKTEWADLILSGDKVWEVRGSQTHIRGKIEVIKSGTGHIYGSVELEHCFPITDYYQRHAFGFHRIDDVDLIDRYKQPWAWVLGNPIIYPEPVPYNHPQGAVIWVNIKHERNEIYG